MRIKFFWITLVVIVMKTANIMGYNNNGNAGTEAFC